MNRAMSADPGIARDIVLFPLRLAIALCFFTVAGPQGQTAQESTNTSTPATNYFVGWATNGPAVFQLSQSPNGGRPSNIFHHFLPGFLPNLVWTNLIAHTNSKDMVLWSVRSHPTNWPRSPPILRWNTNCVLWGMQGLTALSPCWEDEGGSGQAPVTALTRRHGYTRGHSMGADGVTSGRTGKKVWFLTTNNVVVEATIRRALVRIAGARDYTLLLFEKDLPESIAPIRVESGTNLISKYHYCPGAPLPVLKTEQGGMVSLDLPGFTVNTWKPGDSGSPDLLPMPGELIFIGGRSTSSPTPLMQIDMNVLCRIEGIDPQKYQLQWVDFSDFKPY
jgi:hypothetical protein